jgi:hypothetical protein
MPAQRGYLFSFDFGPNCELDLVMNKSDSCLAFQELINTSSHLKTDDTQDSSLTAAPRPLEALRDPPKRAQNTV